MTTGRKGKIKPTGVKGKTKATDLKEFMSGLATDPRKLGEFLHEPEDTMSAANLSEEHKAALRSGVPGMIYARLKGVSMEHAFWPVTLNKASPVPAPQYFVQPPPQHVVYPPPQYVVYPPQFVVQPPPQYVVQPPPQYVVYPPYYPGKGTA
jgi:hypothetical protein